MDYWWKNYPWRLIQTNLREIDMADIDAGRYVESLKELDATVAMINVAGIIASYPTDFPFHFQSEFLDGDSLEQIIAACHSAGIRVVARTDFSKVRRPIYERYPEWACQYGEGVVEDYNGDIHCCINGDYQQKYAPMIIKEAVTKLNVDGIFFNMGGFLTRNYSYDDLGMCRCENCQTRFREMYGHDLPRTEEQSDRVFQAYQEFKTRTVNEHRNMIISTIRNVRPDIAIDKDFVHNLGFYRQESNTEIDRDLPHWQYSASENTKRVVTTWPDLVSSNSTVDFLGFYYRHVAVQPAQQALRLRQNLANCGGLDYYLIGRPDNHRDRSGFDAVKRVFSYHKEHFDDTYAHITPVADVLLVAEGGNQTEYRGWYRVLTETHTLFSVVTNDRVDSLDLSSYSTIVFPDVKRLSASTVAAIETFVRQGGTVIATGETGVLTAADAKQNSPSIGWLGIRAVRAVRTDMRSAVLERPSSTDRGNTNQVLASIGIADRDLIAIGDTFVFADYDEEAVTSHRLIPPHNYGPPERCYWSLETDIPGLAISTIGDGNAIHIPWKPGELYYREGYDNTSGFMFEVLESYAGVLRVNGNLNEMVEVTLAFGKDSDDRSFYLLQLVNGSGHFGNSYFDPVSMHDITMKLRLPQLHGSIESLSGNPVSIDLGADGYATIELAALDEFDAIKIFV